MPFLQSIAVGHASAPAEGDAPREPLPPGVAYIRKRSQPLNVLIAAEEALADGCDVRRQPARASVLAAFERADDRGFFF
jgi:hypothetical protein